MDTHLSLSSLLITLSFFSTVTPPSHCIEDDLFLSCSRPYECGNLKNISFPFWGGERPQYCGHSEYKLECRNDSYTVMKFEELEFRVLNINQSTRIMSIARVDLWDIQHSCPRKFVNTALNYTLFDYNHQTVQNLTLVYNCSSPANTSEEKRFMCGPEGGDRYNYTYYLDEINNTEVAKCRSNIKVPILRRGGATLSAQDPQETGNQTLQIVLNEGFEVKYLNDMTYVCSECEKSGGSCGSNMSYSTAPFVCFCRGEVNSVIICRRDELILTAAVQNSPNLESASFPVDSIRDNLNWVNVMAYDLYMREWYNFTAAQGALYDPSGHVSADDGIGEWIGSGLSASKLVLSLPFYGYDWTLENPSNNGIGAPATGPAIEEDGFMTFKNIKSYIQRYGAAVRYNATYVVKYFLVGSVWVGFDDAEVVKIKVAYAKQKKLLGYSVGSLI